MAPDQLPQPDPQPKTQIEPAQAVSPALDSLRTPLTPARLSRAEIRLRQQNTAFQKVVTVGWVVVVIIYAAFYFYAHQTH